MTSVLEPVWAIRRDSHHDIPDPGAVSVCADLRLVLAPSPTAEGVLDGSWWPQSRDPAAELPALVAAVADRLGVVGRIALNMDAWDTRPQPITVGERVVRLDGFEACLATAAGQHTCPNQRGGLLATCAPPLAPRPVPRSRQSEPEQVSRGETDRAATREPT